MQTAMQHCACTPVADGDVHCARRQRIVRPEPRPARAAQIVWILRRRRPQPS